VITVKPERENERASNWDIFFFFFFLSIVVVGEGRKLPITHDATTTHWQMASGLLLLLYSVPFSTQCCSSYLSYPETDRMQKAAAAACWLQ
jgi:hypothetical protein